MAEDHAALEEALDAFAPAIVDQARAALAIFTHRFPGAHRLA